MVTYVWKMCPHGSLLAVLIFSQQMAHTSSLLASSPCGTGVNLQREGGGEGGGEGGKVKGEQ